jgi:hypothetical protein
MVNFMTRVSPFSSSTNVDLYIKLIPINTKTVKLIQKSVNYIFHCKNH